MALRVVDLGLKLAGIGAILFTAFAFGGKIEGTFRPVVTGFQVQKMQPVDDVATRIWGAFHIDRPSCDFVGLEWNLRGVNRDVGLNVVFEERAKERGGGWQEFGPWVVQGAPDQIKTRSYAVAYHKCHALWRTVTVIYP